MKMFCLIMFVILICAAGISSDAEMSYAYSTVAKTTEDVVLLTMCTDECKKECNNMLMSFGHAFFYAENISDSDVYIYNYKLSPRESVTFSWWAVDRHMGIWFNIESNYITLANRYSDIACIGMYLNNDEIAKLNTFMENNDRYTPISNCSKQVMTCWNVLAERGEAIMTSTIATPSILKREIMKFKSAKKRTIEHNENICYYNGTGFTSYKMEVGS